MLKNKPVALKKKVEDASYQELLQTKRSKLKECILVNI
jgi:hypothetical protein